MGPARHARSVVFSYRLLLAPVNVQPSGTHTRGAAGVCNYGHKLAAPRGEGKRAPRRPVHKGSFMERIIAGEAAGASLPASYSLRDSVPLTAVRSIDAAGPVPTSPG